MDCPQCGAGNRGGARFCRRCGAGLNLRCPACGAGNEAGSTFCDQCGGVLSGPAEVAPADPASPASYTPAFLTGEVLAEEFSVEGERKTVTVLFADVARYSALTERFDPEEVHQIMDGCFRLLSDVVHRYGGTINQFTGDGIMALFGAPLARENHAQQACYAALSIQKSIREYGRGIEQRCGAEFKMRVGLNSGPVFVGAIGDDLRRDYTAVGETTNLAQRMESTATPGTIRVSGTTHALAGAYFEFLPLGKVPVKGKEEPQEAYELVGPGKAQSRLEVGRAGRGLTGFVGRERELGVLEEALEGACSGAGRVVTLVGQAGVGKSRLLLEWSARIAGERCRFLEGRCQTYGQAVPFFPFRALLQTFFQVEAGDPAGAVRERVRNELAGLGGDLWRAAAPFHELLSLEVDDEAYLSLEPAQKRLAVFDAVRGLLLQLSRRRPLVLAFEDIQWIDRTSMSLLDHLVPAVEGNPLLLVLLSRPEGAWPGKGRPGHPRLELEQLSPDQCGLIVRMVLGRGDVDPAVVSFVYDKAGGNPLFVEELTRSLVESGVILRREQFTLSAEPARVEVPDTVQGIIAARIDRLERDLKLVLQAASVIGREFEARLLDAVAGLGKDLYSCLGRLQGLEMIQERRQFPEPVYAFRHALIQDVAYGSLLHRKRSEMHRQVGGVLEEMHADRLPEYADLLAYHYENSSDRDKAVHYLGVANQKAARASAMQEAATYFERAMKLLDSLPESQDSIRQRVSLISRQAPVFHLLIRFEEYYRLLRSFESLALRVGEPGVLGPFLAQLGQCEWTFGDFGQAIQTQERAARLCEAAGDYRELAQVYLYQALTYLYKGDYRRVIDSRGDMLRVLGERPDYVVQVGALAAFSMACSRLGRWQEAFEEGKAALELARTHSDKRMISQAAWTLAVVHALRGDMDLALEQGELAVESASTPAHQFIAQGVLAFVRCRRGETEKGLDALAAIVALLKGTGHVPTLLTALYYLAEGTCLAGRHGESRAAAEELLALAERSGARWHAGFAHRILGEVAIGDDPVRAAEHLDESLACFRSTGSENDLAVVWTACGRLCLAGGDNSRARDYLTRALETFERLGTQCESERVRRILEGTPPGGPGAPG